ncbi:UpxY family transcription antiterminator [Mucilaginibacter sp. SP1R1]|uniref:UpxY family transcription antiterminator n=1 Tax=Mucilaginibacter sp. SP1R1 TaxID=2723091 RepID=UPI00161211ED|nr:UpxY family transcription antiterminator [Mucilaginibacter sp. SP1R1]MBB6149076.1 transcription antitermination factor NusG [Mucilaginibacter sp. SP1R1]
MKEEKIVQLKKASEKHWMVIYTRSRFEKKIDKTLQENGITSFCPVIKSKKKWADRTKLVETPLFSSYVFVKVDLSDQLKVKQVQGVLNFISYCRKPVILKDLEIERIKHIVESYSDIEIHSISSLNIGDTVKIKDGLLLNYQGVIRQITGKSVLMAIEQLDCVLTVKVSLDLLALNAAS